MNRCVFGLCLLMLCFEARPVSAHALSRSQSWWRVEDSQVTVQVRLPWLEIHRLVGADTSIRPTRGHLNTRLRTFLTHRIPQRVKLRDQDANCAQMAEAKIRPHDSQSLLMTWRLHCHKPPPSAVDIDLFFDRAPSHLHLVVLEDDHGRHETILHEQKRMMAFAAGQASTPSAALGLWAQVKRGAFHVWQGLDHLAFVLVLMLLGGRLLTLLWIATGFTVGHMATLSLAALGLVQPNIPSVEVLIGLSITYGALACFVAWFPAHGKWKILALNLALHALLMGLVIFDGSRLSLSLLVASAIFTSCHLKLHENLQHQGRSRVLLAALFGLVHGLAFASGFAELVMPDQLLASLLCFNLGVELAHMAVIVAVAIVWTSVRRTLRPTTQGWVLASTAALLFACGLAWTVERALV
jgi:hypothetical protein